MNKPSLGCTGQSGQLYIVPDRGDTFGVWFVEGVHMGGSDRFRAETINEIELIGFLFFQTEPSHPCAQTEPSHPCAQIEPTGLVMRFFYLFISQTNGSSIVERR